LASSILADSLERCQTQGKADPPGNRVGSGFLPVRRREVVHWYIGFGRSCGPSKMGNSPKIPPEVSSKLRSLAHDLSNAIETVMQAGYLLGQAKLDGDTKKWVALIDTASRDAARINREIRDILRANSE